MEALQQLVESEAKYRTLVEQAFDGILVYEAGGRIVDCNESICQYSGYTPDELKKLTIDRLFFAGDALTRHLDPVVQAGGSSLFDYCRLKNKAGGGVDMEFVTKRLPNSYYMTVGRDITERNKALEQQALFSSIVSSSNDAIISNNLDGKITSWNKAAETFFGYTAGEAIGQRLTMLIPADLRTDEPLMLKKIREGQHVQHYETRRVRKDGSSFEVSLTISPVRNAKGVIIGASKIVRDISERKEAERKLVESEENLKAIFENTSEGFILVDENGIIRAFNKNAKVNLLLNLEKEIQVGMPMQELVGADRLEFFNDIVTRVMAGLTVENDRFYPGARKKGVWINYTFNPVRKANKVVGFCITSRDITERKVFEQQREFDRKNLNALINNTGDLIWSVDRNFRLITSNEAFSKKVWTMMVVMPAKGSSVLMDKLNKTQLQRFRKYYRRAFTGEAFSDTFHTRMPADTWSEVSFYPIHENGVVIGTACFSRDITEWKKAQAALQENFREKKLLAGRLSTILNTLPVNIALLDETGTIVDVNNAWKNFSYDNSFRGHTCGVGANYIQVIEDVTGSNNGDGGKMARGLRNVLRQKIPQFVFEYVSQSPAGNRWFRMMATPLDGKEYMGAVVMHIDISELRKLEQERMESKIAEQRKITEAMLQAQEKERNAIGLELHDNVNQILVGTNLQLSLIRKSPAKHLELLDECMSNIKNAVHENRKIAHELVTPDSTSETLLDLIERLCYNMLQPADIETSVHRENFNELLVNEKGKLAIYRILQEQCINIIKHARAKRVSFSLSTAGHILNLRVTDDGIGAERTQMASGIGLQNMMSRLSIFGGALSIETQPGAGFTLQVKIPLAG